MNCAWAVEDVSEDDDQIPTKIRYNKVSALIKPVFDILGILPGYREQDVSLWFFLFFVLFFAMIIGDGGYGVLILLGTIALTVKEKKVTNVSFLLYVLSIATIIWGAVTGTWFGMESVMNIPFFKKMVIPSIATYPEYFGLTANVTQNAIMKFSFSIGAIQMALGSILSVKKKIPEKDLSWIADIGWTIAIIAMYMLSLNLVIHEDINLKPVFALIGAAFALVVLFGGMSPDKSFGDGLKSGLADAFTQFLNTISCFGNVMSYIRLFAVGMAGVAISQSFNGIAAGMHGPMMIVGIVVVLIGHALNIVMCFLSVVVHGVRLNVLEFSGQVGLEWTGIPYEPFKKM
jgi:V/A-type H+-transporting ATPase subunit I